MTALKITRLDSTTTDFNDQLNTLLAWNEADNLEVHKQVIDIISKVRRDGDKAVIEYTNQFDHTSFKKASDIELPLSELKQAWDSLSAEKAHALQTAANRVRAYAEEQKMQSWQYTEDDGTVLGQKITALDKAGLYVPGGKAAYPSSVLMNAIPAKVA
ncbi:MAG: histidinol dehydrogenase, partial [Methylococcales bacterium]|nr:histidinol dehydrogenase [Methylococcales bacterium]